MTSDSSAETNELSPGAIRGQDRLEEPEVPLRHREEHRRHRAQLLRPVQVSTYFS